MPFFLLAGWVASRITQPHRARFTPATRRSSWRSPAPDSSSRRSGPTAAPLPVTQWWAGIAVAGTLISLSPLHVAAADDRVLGRGGHRSRHGRLVRVLADEHLLVAGQPHPHLLRTRPRRLRRRHRLRYTVVSGTLVLLDTSAGSEETSVPVDALEESDQLGSIARVSRAGRALPRGRCGGWEDHPRGSRAGRQIARRSAPSSWPQPTGAGWMSSRRRPGWSSAIRSASPTT
ncbi:MAG: hypothetical protein WDM88_01115 [Galbitalea sp.]